MKIKSVLFDMDGVIVDSESGAFEIFRKGLLKVGVHITLDELLAYTGKSSRKIADEIITRCQLGLTPEELLTEVKKAGNYYSDSENMEPTSGLVEMLEYLCREGIQAGIVSSTSSKNVLAVLNRLSLLHYFDVVICGDMVTEWKPSPEGYLKAAQYLGSQPLECLVIEDSPIGIQAGLHAGMTVVGYKGTPHIQDTKHAHIEVDSFKELMEQPYWHNELG